jgi:hypothetical protein
MRLTARFLIATFECQKMLNRIGQGISIAPAKFDAVMAKLKAARVEAAS